MDRIDVAIIGGGVIGLAVASSIARKDKDIFIIERNESFGQETSSRNSEVIHSGIYYPTGSLKARTCVKGNRLLYRISQKHNIPCNKTGKLIVATDAEDIGALENLFKQGLENGLEGLEMLESEEIKTLEPNVEARRAIYLPMTGIIDSHALMGYFLFDAKSNGADIIYGSEVMGIDKTDEGYQVSTAGEGGDSYTFLAKVVINCAGLSSDEIAEMIGVKNNSYTLSYCKGDYFRVSGKKSALVKRPIYPVSRSDDTTLGVHATPDMTSSVRLGPDAEYLSSREIDYSVDPDKRAFFYDSVKNFLPFLEEEDLSVDTSGIRPKLQGPGEPFRDFIIKHEFEAGLEGFINLIGIESPGLTASPAVAQLVKKMVDNLI